MLAIPFLTVSDGPFQVGVQFKWDDWTDDRDLDPDYDMAEKLALIRPDELRSSHNLRQKLSGLPKSNGEV